MKMAAITLVVVTGDDIDDAVFDALRSDAKAAVRAMGNGQVVQSVSATRTKIISVQA